MGDDFLCFLRLFVFCLSAKIRDVTSKPVRLPNDFFDSRVLHQGSFKFFQDREVWILTKTFTEHAMHVVVSLLSSYSNVETRSYSS